jgi:SAM-dependent methyltransferase
MDAPLRHAWMRLVSGNDIDEHMHQVGQAAANAELLVSMLRSQHGSKATKLLLVGGGTGQFLDYVDASNFAQHEIVLSDINPKFLERARARFAKADLQNVAFVTDDIESTSLRGPFGSIAVVMVLEHIDWRLGLSNIHRLAPTWLSIIIQRNPNNMTAAIAPNRKLNASLQAFSGTAHPMLVSSEALIEFLATLGYRLHLRDERAVADEKTMLGFSFRRA